MALDRKLSPDQLWVIAQDTPNLSEELLEQLKYHHNSYLGLQEWATAALLAGVESVPPPPAPPVEEPKAPRPLKWKTKQPRGTGDAPTGGESPARRGINGKVIATMILVPLVFLLLLGGLWARLHTAESEEQSGQAQSEVALVAEGPDPQSGQTPTGTAARAGLGSFECATEGTGVSCWGWVADDDIRPMTVVPGLEDVEIDRLAVGRGYAVAVDTEGAVYAWGKNDHGQLGTAAGEPRWDAITVGRLSARAADLVAGEEHACALVDGEVWCFGSNRVGQIRGVPTDEAFGLTEIEGVAEATSLGSSGYSTWALVPDGSIAWGNNKFGQVDPSDSAATLPPTEAPAEGF